MKSKHKTKWTLEEDEFILKFYKDEGPKFCANYLKRTERSVLERAKKFKINISAERRSKNSQKYTKEILQEHVKDSLCYADTLRKMGLIPQAANFTQLKKNIQKFNIDVSHFLSTGQLASLRIKSGKQKNFRKELDISFYLIVGSTIKSDILKKKLYKSGLKKPICEFCDQNENWHQNTKLVMILDHKNGVHNDNRFENLRILCPNCNSTLETHCSKNRKIKTKLIEGKKKREIPSLEILLYDLQKNSYVSVGKRYGVSDNAVRKWIRKYGIEPPKKKKLYLN